MISIELNFIYSFNMFCEVFRRQNISVSIPTTGVLRRLRIRRYCGFRHKPQT